MMHIVLFEPEIPPNTGNIIRLAANTGFTLHLIEPLGFSLDDKHLRRAGLDYRESACITSHATFGDFKNSCFFSQLYAFSTKASRSYHKVEFNPGDALMFGPESRGLPSEILNSLDADKRLRIPMKNHTRSLNLANTVAIAVYEAWRQNEFGSA